MARPLVVVAIGGIVVSVVCLSLASMLNLGRGPPFLYMSPGRYGSYPWGAYPYSTYVPFIESGEVVTRELAWDGGSSVDINFPGAVYFKTGPEWRVSVTGPKSGVEHLRVDGGRIFFDAPRMYQRSSSVEVRITGPSLDSFALNGHGKLILEHIAQRHLEIDIRGSGSVQGNGTVGTLGLRIFGSGNANLGELATGDLSTNIFGSGNAEVAPTGDVDVSLFGSGDVRMRTRPKHLSTKSFGSGRVIQLESGQRESPTSSPDSVAGPKTEQIAI